MHTVNELLDMPRDAAIAQLTQDILAKHRPLLGRNTKVVKNTKAGYLTQVLSMAPATMAMRWTGINMCLSASKGCAGACLQFAGRNGMPYQGLLRIAKANVAVHHPNTFTAVLDTEIRRLVALAGKKDLLPALRPNGLTDQPGMALAIAQRWPDLQVYDYTKRLDYVVDALPPDNLTWTLSRSETNDPEVFAVAQQMQLNVAVVFDHPLPDTFRDFPVIDGDVSDARFLERFDTPHVIGLRLKGTTKAKNMARTTGFAV
jgi:hypothetical protein